jgi:hypothetical protein
MGIRSAYELVCARFILNLNMTIISYSGPFIKNQTDNECQDMMIRNIVFTEMATQQKGCYGFSSLSDHLRFLERLRYTVGPNRLATSRSLYDKMVGLERAYDNMGLLYCWRKHPKGSLMKGGAVRGGITE